jgi:hypothetical protein
MHVQLWVSREGFVEIKLPQLPRLITEAADRVLVGAREEV